MKLAIMQPYFFPYIGYFQLMQAAEEFVVYDNIEYTKRGWISRNRILVSGKDAYISLPLKKDSDYLNVADRYLADVWPEERTSMLNRIKESYRKAPCFQSVFPWLKEVLYTEEKNLFRFLFTVLTSVKNYLGIPTPLVISSSVAIDHTLRSSEKVIALCKARGASIYINPIGGIDLYSKEEFNRNGITLQFLKPNTIQYQQFTSDFIPALSIIDVMMFNSKDSIRDFLHHYSIQ